MLKTLSGHLALALVLLAGVAMLNPAAVAQKADDYKGDPYTAGICPVSGEPLGSMGDPILMNQRGRDVRLCCAGCPAKFEANPSKYLSKIDKVMIEQQMSFYPLDTDVVNGEALGDDTIDIIHFNRLVRLGSQMSAQKFNKSPDKYIAKLNEAVIAKQIESYPLETCVISGEPLDTMGEPIQVVVANRLVQFCCGGCEAKMWEDPAGTLNKISSGGGDGEGSDSK